jgi:FixJ family two-component response regulator
MTTMQQYASAIKSVLMDIDPMHLSVAVIDDEHAVRKALTRLLRSSSIHVEAFASGSEFVERLQTGNWQVVLLDMHIPGLTGFDVLKRIREERPELAVIMITGYEGTDVRQRAYEAGAQGFLLKPFLFSELLDIVRALPDGSAQAHP